MIRRFLLTGFLLTVPATAFAQTPLSPWVREALTKAQIGIATANGMAAASPCGPEGVLSEISNNLSATRERQRAIIILESEAESLRTRTVCFEYDRRLLQDAMRRVLQEMDGAIYACKLDSNRILRDVYGFLADVYLSFLFGGANPSYKDDRLKYRYPFEDLTLREPMFDTGSTVPLCAYTSDYGPHALAYIPTGLGQPAQTGTASFDVWSYGCDDAALATVLGSDFNGEATAFNTFMTTTQDVASRIYTIVSLALSNMNQLLATLQGATPTTLPTAGPPAPHDVVTGCLKPLLPDASSADPEEWENLFLAYPEYADPDKGVKDPVTGDVSFGPVPGEVLPTGLLFTPVVDYFRTMPAALYLSRLFIDRRSDAGQSRPLPKAFVNQKFDTYLSVLSRRIDSNESLQYIGANIEQEMAYLEFTNRDALQKMGEAAEPLKSAVDSLIYAVTEFLPGAETSKLPGAKGKAVEGYIPQLVYFLSRSCVDGHCQQTLDSVAKRAFNPFCRPYTSGDYMDDDTQKRCFCDPAVQGSWGDFDKYCNPDYSPDMPKYNGMQPTLYPGCKEEISSSASSF